MLLRGAFPTFHIRLILLLLWLLWLWFNRPVLDVDVYESVLVGVDLTNRRNSEEYEKVFVEGEVGWGEG